MSEGLRLSSLALFAVGPVVAVPALLRRASKPSATLYRIKGWRWYVPVVLLPVEWLLPPALIAFRVDADFVGTKTRRVVLHVVRFYTNNSFDSHGTSDSIDVAVHQVRHV